MEIGILHRGLSILAASLSLISLCLFAEFKAPEKLAELEEKRMNILRNGDGIVYSNGSLIDAVKDNSFSKKRRDGEVTTYYLSKPVPFSAGDTASFKIRYVRGVGYLDEYHIWEKKSYFYFKVVLSLLPLSVVIFLFFREYRFDVCRFMFIRRNSLANKCRTY